MEQRGWVRVKKFEPGYGWFRGIEGDDVVSLAGGVPQPSDRATTGSDVFCRHRAANAGGADAWRAAYWRCMAGH
jgi:hypothetical protein